MVEVPRSIRAIQKASDVLDTQLILQSFLQYLKKEGPEKFEKFVNNTFLRLISTVHPNETERTTNLMHYTTIQEKYNIWKKDFDSIQSLPTNAPEYRIRREGLNTLRREIKAEIEGLWQSNQLRFGSINVQNEAKRILERYKVIFKAYPLFLKFVKHLAYEAFWRYHAGRYSSSVDWRKMYTQVSHGTSREDTLAAIKQTFSALGVKLNPPKITTPVISFGTWKGGDRDGNPFVIASFTNQTFVEQKEFVLAQYVELAKHLLDKLTISTRYVSVTEELRKSISKDQKLFPYIINIKPEEPYRAKMRYILEKLENTLTRVREVKKQSGETVKPLLGLSLPGPTGYNSVDDLCNDVHTLHGSLLVHESKAQARSLLQDFQILVDTFGLHLTAIDFRQTSEKNSSAVAEYLTAISHPQATAFKKLGEKEKTQLLTELISIDDIELTPWTLGELSKISRDTFETLVIFADAAEADYRSVGKFIISMCQNASDIMIVLFLMKLNNMLQTQGGKIIKCPFDVTGLFETVEDLKAAPRIISDLLSIPIIRNYIMEHRKSKLTVMLGYSDSVRDGSSFASDAQIAKTTLILKQLEGEINRSIGGNNPIQFVFYRGRGDTLPRGFGGSISKALMSQMVTTPEEDHTEQNRYLRRYATVSSALDHLHSVYSSHLSSLLKLPHPESPLFLEYFDFFGKISNSKWNSLVKEADGGRGKEYFQILNNYSILAHLPRSNFASRPVARSGITWDIDTIRAIPFTMALAQMREFTNAYYGLGTALEFGSQILANEGGQTTLGLLSIFMEHCQDQEDLFAQFQSDNEIRSKGASYPSFLDLLERATGKGKDLQKLKESASSSNNLANREILLSTLKLFPSIVDGINAVAKLVNDLEDHKKTPLDVLRRMYKEFSPFRYSIENKETALLIRSKRVVDVYTSELDSSLKGILEETESEAQLSIKWILTINQQEKLVSKTLTQDFESPELFLLHKIQSKWMDKYRKLSHEAKVNINRNKQIQEELRTLNLGIQMSILAISEALGFGG
eukprot:TRINITY_DN4701_c0_g1_i2.p1 TRINITY_DN4701_c0_g1~~TRINITY_DN4701_c0_g1_i2.p1  ORF type:complete len:1027 (+),score=335.62 TRINITY_DN4701_c0_g1_i2:233-3313(+)